MTGSLQQKNGTYYVVVRMPDETGIKKQKWINTEVKTTGKNQRETERFEKKAERRLVEILLELEKQQFICSNDILFTDWVNTWMEQKKHEVRLVTIEGYQIYVDKHILPHFKPLKLKLPEVTAEHIQDYYNRKLKDGLSASSIKRHSVILRGALREAVKKKLIPYNAVDGATLPARKRYISKAYTVEQAKRLLKAIDKEQLKPAIILGLYYGLRRSEVLGLRWSDIDFNAGTITIRNTVVRVKTQVEAELTKSQASNRTLFIIPETVSYLKKLRRQQNKNRALLGDAYNVNDHVCVWDDGTPFKLNYVSRRFGQILTKYKLPKIRFHELRHTAGSVLLNNGLSIKQIQEFLGHEQVSTTLDIYGHLSVEGKRETAYVMGGLLKTGA